MRVRRIVKLLNRIADFLDNPRKPGAIIPLVRYFERLLRSVIESNLNSPRVLEKLHRIAGQIRLVAFLLLVGSQEG